MRTTIIQQCLTKIYLADPSALTAGMFPVYSGFGLTDSEIALIAASEMKRDYFYTSPLGRRRFQLDLGPLTLAIIGAPQHELLDSLAKERCAGVPLCKPLLDALRVDYKQYVDAGAPDDDALTKTITEKTEKERRERFSWDKPAAPLPPPAEEALPEILSKTELIFEAAAALPERSRKGAGCAAELAAQKLGLSPATLYQARRLLKSGDQTLIERARSGELSIKKACSLLKHADAPEEAEQAAS